MSRNDFPEELEQGRLTDKDHDNLDEFIREMIRGYDSGKISVDDMIGHWGQVIAALDTGNIGEVQSWLAKPKTYFYES